VRVHPDDRWGDAMSVGIAAHTFAHLHTAQVDEAITALRALIEHREDMVHTRTQTINRLQALLADLVPADLPSKRPPAVRRRSRRRTGHGRRIGKTGSTPRTSLTTRTSWTSSSGRGGSDDRPDDGARAHIR
jgi:hypothetical protein